MKKFIVFLLSFIVLWGGGEWLIGLILTLMYQPKFDSVAVSSPSDAGIFSAFPELIAASVAYFLVVNKRVKGRGGEK
ncbi:hypothetical protein [Halobacillus mangrovi]|uniref:Uncharacterized protein n=1 Tax=Halobacillus mangrovi TaxID=402384 RepID=A0A1W6A0E8_9BACI|nr:hypothetical protein [Halobacillus mangrovi]ARI78961.1 hypothetical protein HM131_19970 [Halobacillus mangrovi]